MHTKNPIFDEAAKFVTGAMGAAQAAGDEVQSLVRSQTDRIIADMDLASRDEFEALKALSQAALERIDALEAKIEALEKRLDGDA